MINISNIRTIDWYACFNREKEADISLLSQILAKAVWLIRTIDWYA